MKIKQGKKLNNFWTHATEQGHKGKENKGMESIPQIWRKVC